MMANRSKTTKDETDLELEKVLHLSQDDLEEKCAESERKFNEAMKALLSSSEPSPL
jgi:hypothetical protein